MPLEIERKFLLKRLPSIKSDKSIDIEQFYLKNKSGIWERARSIKSADKKIKYIHTIKHPIYKNGKRVIGVNMEDEYLMTKEQFLEFKNKCNSKEYESKFIKKIRHIYSDGDLYWEVDEFNNGYKLIIAEIELPKKSYKLKIPDFIKSQIIFEVTNFKQFNNRNLSLLMS